MGAQDTDLVLRLKMLHSGDVYEKVRETVFSQAIPNDLKAKVACCDPQYVDAKGNRMRWGQMDTVNRAIFQARREDGHVRRNLEKLQIGVRCKRVRA